MSGDTNPAPPVDDARVTPKISDAVYLAMRNILTPERCRALLDGTAQAHAVIYDLFEAANPAPSLTADEARTLLKLIEMRCLSRSLRDSTGDIDLLKRAAVLLSRIPSEEATEEVDVQKFVTVSPIGGNFGVYINPSAHRPYVWSFQNEGTAHQLAGAIRAELAGLRITRAPGGGT